MSFKIRIKIINKIFVKQHIVHDLFTKSLSLSYISNSFYCDKCSEMADKYIIYYGLETFRCRADNLFCLCLLHKINLISCANFIECLRQNIKNSF